MRKEVSIAIIIGIILGGVILYGIKIANETTSSLGTPKPTPSLITSPTPTSTNQESKNTRLNITSHAAGQVLFEKEIILSGKTIPSSQISIIWEDDEIITKTNVSGEFSQKITLISGENNIQIDVVDQNNNLISETLRLYYSSKPIN